MLIRPKAATDFPRGIPRGLIEAATVDAFNAVSCFFPRGIPRGLIEAAPTNLVQFVVQSLSAGNSPRPH